MVIKKNKHNPIRDPPLTHLRNTGETGDIYIVESWGEQNL